MEARMSEIVGRILLGIIEGFFEFLCHGTGQRILQFLGIKKQNYLASFFLGLVVWISLACALAGFARSH
jgi:hypothetical protein